MSRKITLGVLCAWLVFGGFALSRVGTLQPDHSSHYLGNRSPLVEKPYIPLPLGAVKPEGWLLEQLRLMRSGMTGHLDELYEKVVGPRNGWLGGDGDGWERGPYWLDGLLPLAYLLDDEELKEKVMPWIEWTLTHQAESGYFGPVPFEEEPAPEPEVRINGLEWTGEQTNQTLVIDRTWEDGDTVELSLPMEVRFSRWAENSVAVERGPLVYALKIREAWRQVASADRWGDYEEVYPRDAWNYGLLEAAIGDPESGFQVVKKETVPLRPWNVENAPVALHTKGKRIPEWQLYSSMAGPLLHSRPQLHLTEVEPEEITLIPYGCTTLRITEFPVVR